MLRTGYLLDIYPHYRDIFKREFENKIHFTKVSEKVNRKKYKILVIGDSFSDQGSFGYVNYLAKDTNNSILSYDRFLSKNNSVQGLYDLLNGDFFDNYKFDFVILQSVERAFVTRAININKAESTSVDNIDALIEKNRKERKENEGGYKFPSSSLLKFPYYSIQYCLHSNQNYLFNNVYKAKIDSCLFSTNNSELLFFSEDLLAVSVNNNNEKVKDLNKLLNDLNGMLNNRGIKLIVLTGPDKYDLYYKHIVNKERYPKPIFFEIFNNLDKKYIYINSKQILSKAISQKKDIYFYDDTHWSPLGSQLIADEIKDIMILNRKQK